MSRSRRRSCQLLPPQHDWRSLRPRSETHRLQARLKRPPSPWIEFLQVPKGFDVADTTIEERCAPGDLVVTQDIPLADAVITLGATALSPRGVLFTRENIRERLNMRDFMDTMRASGIEMSQPPVLSKQDRQKFANGLDKWLRQTASS